ncbi:amino acid ABC transporter permease [Bosea sp. (in: a-proteobacteria)]|jgi:polar amino acid transport system permease protein|uniref:amino acid ABC transporter permease n=1 Tax=Bosea sp. (in: a-proteobacteria) TaxID=1871050 RepID=UPI00086D04B6|nr:amino acid ABC transporter permease [Bosea sp. (in: a-proteobacteria)]MBN9437770.1 amino acid ABC transporter permease [Bosea sp. (in: a-proteobacteria)]MBN9445809.1 amino acid ABC transporter permease [Bosea sp. (in: a-proteobacteria)]MBN9469855.1 amino acid ABC transporter permease [Bosea sp. (in: a-proteobacteria)]ODT54870.1 MAG: ABC transporter permease [Methylobacterium sp. SCN 67-24]
MYTWRFDAVWGYRDLFLTGTAVTIGLTIAVVILGLVVGLVAGLAQLSRSPTLRWLSWLYIEMFRLTPLLVLLLWFYYALPMLTGIKIDALTAAVVTLSLYGGSFYAEVIRGGIVSIEAGQSEAGLALGMTPGKVMRRIVLPQAIKRMIPPLMNQSIIQFKNTSLVSVLAVPDLLYQGQIVAMETYRALEVYSVIAAIYFVVLLPATVIVKRAEKRLSQSN